MSPRRALGVCALLLGAALAGGLGSTGEATPDLRAWVQQHPLPGAHLDTRSSEGTLDPADELDARVVMDQVPTAASLRAVMQQLCRFDEEADPVGARYSVVAGTVSMQTSCPDPAPDRMFALWQAFHGLPGVAAVRIEERAVQVAGTEAGVLASAPGILATLAASPGTAGEGRLPVLLSGRSVRIDAVAGDLLVEEIALLAETHRATHERLRAAYAGRGRVLARTDLTPQEAVALQARLAARGPGTRVTVLPAKLRGDARLRISATVRPLLDELAGDPRVTEVEVFSDRWVVHTEGTAESAELQAELAADSRAQGLSRITVAPAGEGPSDANCRAHLEPGDGSGSWSNSCGVT